MQYLLLIYTNENQWYGQSEAEQNAVYAEFGQFFNSMAEGQYKGGSQLQPVATATTVRVANGKRVVTDGPFAETKEQLGGYMLIDVEDLDQAIAIAARVPTARMGPVEIRPLSPPRSAPAR